MKTRSLFLCLPGHPLLWSPPPEDSQAYAYDITSPVAAETGNEVRQQGSDGFGQGRDGGASVCRKELERY